MKKPKLRLVVPPKLEDVEFYDINLSKIPARYREGDLLAIRVEGSSLANAGIHDGYMCFIAVGAKINPGKLASVKTIGDVNWVRYCYFGPGGTVRLQSANREEYPDRIYRSGQFEIIGPVVHAEPDELRLTVR